ncbi:MAG TPA: hypothetical protein VEC99_03960 [Clostridia bacterium]|nr:hypothetical protein [Clostridia bacterium]
MTNSSVRAFTISCISFGEHTGPHLLPARSARTFTLLDELGDGQVNGPVCVHYAPAYGALKERVEMLLKRMLGSRIQIIKWKSVVSQDGKGTNYPTGGNAWLLE